MTPGSARITKVPVPAAPSDGHRYPSASGPSGSPPACERHHRTGERRDGLALGTVLGSPGWDRASERIFLVLVAGANVVTVRGG